MHKMLSVLVQNSEFCCTISVDLAVTHQSCSQHVLVTFQNEILATESWYVILHSVGEIS